MDFLNRLQIFNGNINVTNKIKCINSLKITINGVLQIWNNLSSIGLKFLFTRRLNQDCLENHFGAIRQQSGNCRNPSPTQFQRAFKKLLCLNLFHSGTENCEGDGDNLLLRITDISLSGNHIDNKSIDSENPTAEKFIFQKDYQTDNNLETNLKRYISGYLIKKSLIKHNCEICESYANAYKVIDSTSIFCHLKAYKNTNSDSFGNLMMPHDNFVYFVCNLDTIFNDNFETFSTSPNIVKRLVEIGKNINYIHPCPHFPKEYIITLFMRVKLFYTLKYINKNFKNINKNKLIVWRHL